MSGVFDPFATLGMPVDAGLDPAAQRRERLAGWIDAGRADPRAMEVLWHAAAVFEDGGAAEDCPFDAETEARQAERWRDHFKCCARADDKRKTEAAVKDGRAPVWYREGQYE